MTAPDGIRELRWTDFEDSERWRVSLGVWWRIIVLSIGLWIAMSVIIGVLALVLLSIGNVAS